VRIYCGSGRQMLLYTCRAHLVCALTRWQRFSVLNDCHGCHLESLTSYQESNSISLWGKIPAIFHPDPIRNDRALVFFEEVAPTRIRRRKRRWVAICNQFPVVDPEIEFVCISSLLYNHLTWATQPRHPSVGDWVLDGGGGYSWFCKIYF